MKNKDVKIGMKVVPHRKTVPGWDKLSKSFHWARSGGKKQGFLYVVGKDKEEECWVLSSKKRGSGDFFYAGDFKPYEQPTK